MATNGPPTLSCAICGHELENEPTGTSLVQPEEGSPDLIVLVRLCDDCWEILSELWDQGGRK